jgi:hypothetical protein
VSEILSQISGIKGTGITQSLHWVGYGLCNRGIGVRIATEEIDVSLLRGAQNGSEAYAATCPVRTDGLLPRVKAAGK